MVEESAYSANKPKSRAARPKPVYLWTVQDVQKWFRRHCSDYYHLYAEKFQHHEITGRTLVRITEGMLLRLGVDNPNTGRKFGGRLLSSDLRLTFWK